ncbi:transmembrane protease serine 11G-like [Cydia splendana]|uniref:transmembrane protease serine 11G-like n=1 Tax=Cydia splendana TaxID=1100963 RepID=UPI0028F478E2
MLIFTVIYFSCAVATNDIYKEPSVSDIASHLVDILAVNSADNPKLNELREKLKTINKYVIDKEKMAELLLNESRDITLTETNFYEALNDNDGFRLLQLNEEPKNLYLKLKEKFNRDDILKIISEKNSTGIVQSFRRSMNMKDEVPGLDEEVIEEIVDKMLGEKLKDEHKFDENNLTNIYWDPKSELEDLKEHHSRSGRRIYKGERTVIQKYPFMVSVHIMGRFWCGGVLYWHDLVLTSAACLQLMHNNRFFRENPRVLQVRIGSNHSRISGELVDALEVYFHPTYNPRTLADNIAVIRLRYRIAFDHHRVPKIIDISHFDHNPAATEVLVLGWGVTRMSNRLAYEPVFLQRKFLPVYPNSFCKEVYGDKFITKHQFCAGTLTTGEGACDHDAGGPAILSGKLVGIISFGPTVCGYANAPTVFTLVGAYADWIEQVNDSMPDYYRLKVRTTTLGIKPNVFKQLNTLVPERPEATI